MKKDIKKISFLILIGIITILTPAIIFADTTGTGVSGPIFPNPLKVNSVTELLSAVLDIVVQIGLVIVVFFIIYAGFQFVTAQGNSTKLTKAREGLIATLIGSAIVLGSYAIAKVLKDTVEQLKAGTGVSYQLPVDHKFKV